jgi:hypothetical protein
MTSRREFEREKLESFTLELFWALESWIDSIKSEDDDESSRNQRQQFEEFFRRGTIMRVSKLSLIVDATYKRLYSSANLAGKREWEEICLNNVISQLVNYARSLIEIMESSITVSDHPQVTIWAERKRSGSLFTFVIWWVLDAWPDSQIIVDFVDDGEKVHVIFHDTTKVHTCREYEKRSHKNLLVWSHIIDHLSVVEYHGWCIWPQIEEPRQLEIILPLRPPTDEELDAPVPAWMQ